jgi:hypothetical protein
MANDIRNTETIERQCQENYPDDASELIRINDDIEKHGCHIIFVEANNYLGNFAYTIGLYRRFKHPEIICFNLNHQVSAQLLNHVCEQIKESHSFETGKNYSGVLKHYDVQFLKVEKGYYRDYLGYAVWYYGKEIDFTALQLVWPDRRNAFPWENNFMPAYKFKQPLLDRNTDFKFYEERRKGVVTTRQVCNGEPILYVSHDNEGHWQFHTGSAPKQTDAVMVCFEAITKLDPTINELFDLQYGWHAWRNSLDDKWKYESNE